MLCQSAFPAGPVPRVASPRRRRWPAPSVGSMTGKKRRSTGRPGCRRRSATPQAQVALVTIIGNRRRESRLPGTRGFRYDTSGIRALPMHDAGRREPLETPLPSDFSSWKESTRNRPVPKAGCRRQNCYNWCRTDENGDMVAGHISTQDRKCGKRNNTPANHKDGGTMARGRGHRSARMQSPAYRPAAAVSGADGGMWRAGDVLVAGPPVGVTKDATARWKARPRWQDLRQRSRASRRCRAANTGCVRPSASPATPTVTTIKKLSVRALYRLTGTGKEEVGQHECERCVPAKLARRAASDTPAGPAKCARLAGPARRRPRR